MLVDSETGTDLSAQSNNFANNFADAAHDDLDPDLGSHGGMTSEEKFVFFASSPPS